MRMIYLRHQGNNILKGIIYFEEMVPVGNDKSRFSWYNIHDEQISPWLSQCHTIGACGHDIMNKHMLVIGNEFRKRKQIMEVNL